MISTRRTLERVLATVLPADLAFNISDLGNVRDIDYYDVPLSAFERYWVDPFDIERMTGREWKPWSGRTKLLGKVQSGDWDQRPPDPDPGIHYPQTFSERRFHIAARRHYEEGVPWEETKYWENQGAPGNGDEEFYKDRIQKFDRLVETIQQQGYCKQSELEIHPADKRMRYADEITVDVARDGEFLFVDGRHRLSAARILSLNAVPVTVLVRHKKWVRKLESIREGSSNEIDPDHPEVRRCIVN